MKGIDDEHLSSEASAKEDLSSEASAKEELSSQADARVEELTDRGAALVDLPLQTDVETGFSLPLASENRASAGEPPPVASLGARWPAFAADGAAVVLLAAAALLLAMVWRAEAPRIQGLFWAAGFVVYLSGFATIVPLVLFGRTVGMALTGLSACDEGVGRRLTPRQSAQRWAGTLLTAATLGAPLLWTMRSPATPTPADRLSGRPLVEDESRVESRESGV